LIPLRLRGASPQRPDGRYTGRGLPPGEQKLYLRFPSSKWKTDNIRDTVHDPIFTENELQVPIYNSNLYGMMSPLDKCVLYSYFFTHDCKTVSLRFNDEFIQHYYYRTGKHFDMTEYQRLLQVEYWDGAHWRKLMER